jgi:hypothetical protein
MVSKEFWSGSIVTTVPSAAFIAAITESVKSYPLIPGEKVIFLKADAIASAKLLFVNSVSAFAMAV